jgi:hypothetical protein
MTCARVRWHDLTSRPERTGGAGARRNGWHAPARRIPPARRNGRRTARAGWGAPPAPALARAAVPAGARGRRGGRERAAAAAAGAAGAAGGAACTTAAAGGASAGAGRRREARAAGGDHARDQRYDGRQPLRWGAAATAAAAARAAAHGVAAAAPSAEGAGGAPPELQRPRSAPAAKILIETYHPATRKAVLSDWKLLEEPAEAAADEETLQAISQREAAEAGRRMLEQGGGAETGGGGGGGGGGGVVGDVSADAEHTWLKLPRGRSHMGGQQPMGYVRGFKAYHLRSIRHTSGTLD